MGKESRLVVEVVSLWHCLTHLTHSLDESALAVEHHGNDCGDAEEHDDALDEVVDGCGLISTEDDIHGGEHGHDDGTIGIRYAESHLEEF